MPCLAASVVAALVAAACAACWVAAWVAAAPVADCAAPAPETPAVPNKDPEPPAKIAFFTASVASPPAANVPMPEPRAAFKAALPAGPPKKYPAAALRLVRVISD